LLKFIFRLGEYIGIIVTFDFMKMELRHGPKNIKGKKSQSIYIRVKHSNLDWDKSLGIVIDPENWDFKKREIITTKALNNPLETERLREFNREVHEISKHLKYAAESFYYTNTFEVKQWVKDKNRPLWIERCETWYKEYKDRHKKIIQPYFTEAFNETIERLEPDWTAAETKVRWESIGRNIQQFMDKKGQIRTDDMSKNVWSRMTKFFENEYYSVRTDTYGLSKSTIRTILKKIKAVYYDLEDIYIFHNDIKNFKWSYKKKKMITLTDTEINQLWEYKGGKDSKQTARRLWFYMVQYYGCFRISEVKLNLAKSQAKNSRLKTPRELWDSVSMDKDSKGKNIFTWRCYVKKQNGEIKTKNVPIHRRLAECFWGYMPKDLNDTDKFPKELTVNGNTIHKIESEKTYRQFINSALNDLGIDKRIKSHDIRKSFITNAKKKHMKIADIQNYSGHESEGAVLAYINDSDTRRNTEMDLDN